MSAHSLQSLVDEGYAPSVRWLAEGIKRGDVPGHRIGRYWKNWMLTDDDLEQFLTGTQTAPVTPEAADVEQVSEPDLIMAGLSSRTARRLRRAS
jgi:hypothetical protein